MATYTNPESIVVADGVETVFGFNFPYLVTTDLVVTVNDVVVPTVLASISQVLISPAPADQAVVRIYRNTPAQNPAYQFSGGIPFLPRYVDENNRQLLYAVQEGLLAFTQTVDEAEKVMQRSVRAPASEITLQELPLAVDRAGKILGFNDMGQPIAFVPAEGDGTNLGLALAQAGGSGMVGHKDATPVGYPMPDPFAVRTVKDALQDMKCLSDFAGFVGDGINDDSDAFEAAVDWQQNQAQIWNPPVGSGFASAAVVCPGLTVPKGARIKLGRKVRAPLWMQADGHASIEAALGVDMLEKNGSYKVYMNGFYFIGGKSHIKLDNNNVNFGLWMFDHCTFIGASDWSTQFKNTSVSYPVTSTQLIFNECRWVRNKRMIYTECDHSFVVGGWMQPESDWCDDNTAQIYNGGVLSMMMMMVIPASITPFGTKTRLIDNYGAVRCHQVRFGGEGGGLPIIYHYAEPTRYVQGTAKSIEMGIALNQCSMYPGPGSRPDAAVIVIQGHLPPVVRITDCTGPITRPFILNDPANGGIADIAAYISAFQTAWGGDYMRNEFSYHITGTKWKHSIAMWPAALDSYVFVDKGHWVDPIVKMRRTATQSIPAATLTKALLNVTAHDPWAMNVSASDTIITPAGAKFVFITGQIEFASHSAPVVPAAGAAFTFKNYYVRVYLNGTPTDIWAEKPHLVTGVWRITFSGGFELPINAGNAIELRVFQDSGAPLNLTYASASVRMHL